MAKEVKNLKWRNKWSGEEGYVMTVSPKNNCFFNSFDKAKAKKYTSDASIDKDLKLLAEMGEMENNEFFVET